MDEITITPLSELRGQATGLQRHYPQGAGRDQRIAGDQHLLVGLTKACRGLERSGEAPPRVADLPESALRRIVEEVETVHYGSWRLAGEDTQPILERLDAHFRPQQEAWLADRQRRDAEAARRTAWSAQAV